MAHPIVESDVKILRDTMMRAAQIAKTPLQGEEQIKEAGTHVGACNAVFRGGQTVLATRLAAARLVDVEGNSAG